MRQRAAIAVASTRRFTRERHRRERLLLIARVGQLVAGNLELDDLLEQAADSIHEVLGYENVAIPLIDSADPEFMVLTAFGGSYKTLIGGRHRLPLTNGLMGAAARTREVVLVNDVGADPRYLPTPGGVKTLAELAVPILLGNQVLGVINVESTRPFTSEDADGLRIVADELAVAIENTRLHEAVRRVAVLEERQRLARELHDSVTQQLFSAILVAQTLSEAYAASAEEGERRADAVLELARAALAEMRALLAELRPISETANPPCTAARGGELSVVRQDGLIRALRAHARSPELEGLSVSVRGDGWTPQNPACEAALYRIAREALHNVVKHARATRVEMHLEMRGGSAVLSVHDDGCGFEATTTQSPGATDTASGLGLVSMRERVGHLGGALRVESVPGRGTLIEATVPLHVVVTS